MQRFKKILFVVDPKVDNVAALKRAAALASANQASLALLEIVDPVPHNTQTTAISPEKLLESVITAKREQLIDMAGTVVVPGKIEPVVNVRVGRAFLEIIREVLRNDYDLVIKSAAGKLKTLRLFGSTDMHLMRKCPCPVWLVKSTDQESYHRVLAAVDQDPESTVSDDLNRSILEIATSLTLAESGELHIVHAWMLAHEAFLRSHRSDLVDSDVDAIVEEEQALRLKSLEHLVETVAGKDKDAIEYVKPTIHLKQGNAREEVTDLARKLEVDLVVMGTVGRVGIPGFFMGNTAEEILEQIDCSVLAIKPPGFVSPVSLPATV